MSAHRGMALVGLVLAGCSSSGTRGTDPGPTVHAAAIPDAAVEAPAAIPDGWVPAEGPGWRAALPVSPTFVRMDSPPELEIYSGHAKIAGGATGAVLTFMFWPPETQRADRPKFERNFLAGYRDSFGVAFSPAVAGTFETATETCNTQRYQGRHPMGEDIDVFIAVCIGRGFALAWVGAPSRLDEMLAHFVFMPEQLGPQ